MFLEEFRALPLLGGAMAASSCIFTCVPLASADSSTDPKITIGLIVNYEKSEEIKEPIVEEVKVPEPAPVIEPPAEVIKPPEPEIVKPIRKPKRKIPKSKRRSTVNNYKTRTRDNRDVFEVVPKKGNNYWLYRPHRKLDFSFKFNDTDFSNIKEDSIRIKLFKKSAWEDGGSWNDEYGSYLTVDQIRQLFGDKEEQDPNKTKQLLFSLSVNRYWRKHADDHYNSDSLELLYTKLWYMDIKIKYFTEFEELKEYVQAKVDNCRDSSPCIVKEEELAILPQDKISFFNP